MIWDAARLLESTRRATTAATPRDATPYLGLLDIFPKGRGEGKKGRRRGDGDKPTCSQGETAEGAEAQEGEKRGEMSKRSFNKCLPALAGHLKANNRRKKGLPATDDAPKEGVDDQTPMIEEKVLFMLNGSLSQNPGRTGRTRKVPPRMWEQPFRPSALCPSAIQAREIFTTEVLDRQGMFHRF